VASVEELLDQMVRLQALQIKMAFNNQAEAIVEMNKAGIGPSRIAELLGTTPGTVGVAIQRAKPKPSTKPKKTIKEKKDA
jgi:DNA-directed RNA polymerase specialized sigma24 family protein